MKRKTPAEVRKEAARKARAWAVALESEGNPEGAGVLRDLASAIEKIRLTA